MAYAISGEYGSKLPDTIFMYSFSANITKKGILRGAVELLGMSINVQYIYDICLHGLNCVFLEKVSSKALYLGALEISQLLDNLIGQRNSFIDNNFIGQTNHRKQTS